MTVPVPSVVSAIVRSSNETSRPNAVRSILSSAVLKSVMVSSPSPGANTKVSLPPPPVIVSSPYAPVMISSAVVPVRVSSTARNSNRSAVTSVEVTPCSVIVSPSSPGRVTTVPVPSVVAAIVRSSNETSRPNAVRSILSSAVLKSVTVSSPSPGSNTKVSPPPPPVIVSSPVPPVMISSAVVPAMVLSPAFENSNMLSVTSVDVTPSSVIVMPLFSPSSPGTVMIVPVPSVVAVMVRSEYERSAPNMERLMLSSAVSKSVMVSLP